MLTAVCGVILVMVAVKVKAEWLLNGCIRGVLGTIAIFFMNSFLEKQGLDLGIGINAVTVLTSAILGFPGVAALYGVGFYRIL
ncbi:MAG: pro-sigmaK processing inhibitor BofA family protein [Lachnospiraceae bacterium]|nr:pro-sigmaK processing inhibitor BofA family protein [Lachnospiraceae bacterium]MBR5508804.1 pro-sigmaK processing inhibitor BofA family protein [Lachnospiraceae bacterium]